MKTIGSHKERPLSLAARGDLLKEGALFNTEIQKLQSSFRFPKGLYRYKSHEDADRHWTECIVANIVAVQEARRGQ
jgi:hypothetical protein